MKDLILLSLFVFSVYVFLLIVASEYNSTVYITATINVLFLWIETFVILRYYKKKNISNKCKLTWILSTFALVIFATILLLMRVEFSWILVSILFLIFLIFLIGILLLYYTYKRNIN